MTRRARQIGVEDERSDARERALILLYEAESKSVAPSDVVDAQILTPDALTQMLVRGVEANGQQIDDLIATHSKGWTIQRMPTIDRNVLRIGTFELLQRPDVPVAVVIDEAVELAKRFSTDNSGRFVNGVLAALAGDLRNGGGAPSAGDEGAGGAGTTASPPTAWPRSARSRSAPPLGAGRGSPPSGGGSANTRPRSAS